MPLSVINKLLCATQDELLDAIKDCAVAAGWTLHDTSATGYCLSSQGESGNHYPLYLHMYKSSATVIYCYLYLGWNLTTHVGLGGYIGSTTYSRIMNNASGGTYLWASINKDSFAVVSYAGTPRHGMKLIQIATPIIELPALGVLQSDVAAGASVVLQLAAGEADRFVVGNNYQILGLSGTTTNRNYVEVSAVDTTLHQITITTLAYAFKATSRIGHLPHPWIDVGSHWTAAGSWVANFPFTTNGTAVVSGTTTDYQSVPFSILWVDPDLRSGKFIAQPFLYTDIAGTSAFGVATINTTFLRVYIDTSSEHTVAIGEHDFGTSSGSNTTTTLNDTAKSWTVNEFTDKVLMITAGTGQGQFRMIASNTATEITITAAFATTPDATSQYSIADEGWLYLYVGGTANQSGILRML